MKKLIFVALTALFFTSCTDKAQSNTYEPSVIENLFTPKFVSSEAKSKIAIIVPEKIIKSYSNIIINSAISYALRQKAPVSVDVFLIGTEDDAVVASVARDLVAKDYRFAIAGFTLKGANALAAANVSDLSVYIPTLHKKNTRISADNIYFGGIDYDAQISKLLAVSGENVASFYDNSSLANILNQRVLALSKGARAYKIDGDKIDFKRLMRSQGTLSASSIFLNTPLVKSAIISSQLRAQEFKHYTLLSTQIGFNPTLLSLTQPEDRENLYIANSIANEDTELSYINEMLGQSVDYNWVAYATNVGFDYFYTQKMGGSKRLFSEKMQNNQITYDIKIIRAMEFSFVEHEDAK